MNINTAGYIEDFIASPPNLLMVDAPQIQIERRKGKFAKYNFANLVIDADLCIYNYNEFDVFMNIKSASVTNEELTDALWHANTSIAEWKEAAEIVIWRIFNNQFKEFDYRLLTALFYNSDTVGYHYKAFNDTLRQLYFPIAETLLKTSDSNVISKDDNDWVISRLPNLLELDTKQASAWVLKLLDNLDLPETIFELILNKFKKDFKQKINLHDNRFSGTGLKNLLYCLDSLTSHACYFIEEVKTKNKNISMRERDNLKQVLMMTVSIFGHLPGQIQSQSLRLEIKKLTEGLLSLPTVSSYRR